MVKMHFEKKGSPCVSDLGDTGDCEEYKRRGFRHACLNEEYKNPIGMDKLAIATGLALAIIFAGVFYGAFAS